MSCSAAPDATVEPEPTTTEAPPPPAVVHTHDAPAPHEGYAPPARLDVRSALPSAITSVVTEPDGTTWTAGWFRDVVKLGPYALRSRGESDVFLARTDTRGEVVWAVSAGSPEAEHNARVSLVDDGSGNVAVMALTEGRIDCGAGALQQWGEETYFFCRYRKSDGALVDGASFPAP